MRDAMRVQEFARRCGISPHTVRYYARLGLLRPARNAANDYQDFDEADLVRYGVIRAGRSIGLSLDEIGELLNGVPRSGCCGRFREVLVARLREIRVEIAQLQERQRLLESTLAQWAEQERPFCSPADASDTPCPVIRVARDSGLDL